MRATATNPAIIDNICMSRVLILIALIAGLVTTAARGEKIKVLVITGGHDFEQKSFLDVFKANPEMTFTHAARAKSSATAYEHNDLLTCDGAVLYDIRLSLTAAQQAECFSLCDRGTGLSVLHHALVGRARHPLDGAEVPRRLCKRKKP